MHLSGNNVERSIGWIDYALKTKSRLNGGASPSSEIPYST